MNPRTLPSGVHDVAQAEAAGKNQHTYQRKPQRNFVTDHLRAGPQPAQHGVLAVRRPSRQCHAVNADRSDAQNDQQADIDVGDLHRRVHAANLDPGARPELPRSKSAQHHRDHRRRDVERLVHVRRRQVFLEHELHAICQRLQNPKGPTRVGPHGSACAPPLCAPAKPYRPRRSAAQRAPAQILMTETMMKSVIQMLNLAESD